MLSGCKRTHKPESAFSGFSQTFIELYWLKVQRAPETEISTDYAKLEIFCMSTSIKKIEPSLCKGDLFL